MMYPGIIGLLLPLFMIIAINYYFVLKRRRDQRLDREYCKEKIERCKSCRSSIHA